MPALTSSDALSCAVGVACGLAVFASSSAEFVGGTLVLALLLSTLSTPRALDVDAQALTYLDSHPRHANRVLHTIVVWPLLWTAFMLLASSTANWATVLSVLVAIYTLGLGQWSRYGVTAAVGVWVLYVSARPIAAAGLDAVGPQFVDALMALHVALWVGWLVLERTPVSILKGPFFSTCELVAVFGAASASPLLAAQSRKRLQGTSAIHDEAGDAR